MTPSRRVAIGLGVPFMAVVPTVPLLASLRAAPLGVPITVLWLFGCIPLTSACLALCWFLHDRYDQQDRDEAAAEDGGPTRP